MVGHPLGKNAGDVWRISPSHFRGAHFATYPEALIQLMIRAGCPKLRCSHCRAPYIGVHMQVHHHYLKGSLWCARCEAAGRQNRLIYMEAKGGKYAYYFCFGRYEHDCDLPFLRVEAAEDAVERHYGTLTLPGRYAENLLAELEAGLESEQRIQRDLVTNLNKELANLDEQADRLLHALMNGLSAEAKVQRLMNDIQIKRRSIEGRIAQTEDHLLEGLELTKTWIALAERPDEFYSRAVPDARTQLNRAFFERLILDLDDGNGRVQVAHELREPVAGIYRTAAELAEADRARPSTVIENMKEGRPVLLHQSIGDMTYSEKASNMQFLL